MLSHTATNRKWVGHLAVLTAYLIFGLNIVVCKDLTSSSYISPLGIFTLRSIGAGAIFWLISLFMKPEKVARKDYLPIFFASVLGFFLTQLTFLMAIPLIKPAESALMSSLTPIYTMVIAAIVLKEPVTIKKITGVVISLAGIVYLILTGMAGSSTFGSSMLGLLLMVGNSLFFAMYLGIFRPLIERYSVVTFMKWIFLFSTLLSLPLTFGELTSVNLLSLPATWLRELAFLIVFATFIAYFLIPLGQKIIRPTLISMYSYMQPIVAIGISICVGMDTLTIAKVIATLMVFSGVYIVSRSRSAATDNAKIKTNK